MDWLRRRRRKERFSSFFSGEEGGAAGPRRPSFFVLDAWLLFSESDFCVTLDIIIIRDAMRSSFVSRGLSPFSSSLS
jgi:hypothetical protein